MVVVSSGGVCALWRPVFLLISYIKARGLRPGKWSAGRPWAAAWRWALGESPDAQGPCPASLVMGSGTTGQ